MSDRLTEMNNALEKRRDSLIKIDTPSFDERQETLEERRDRLTELPASQKHNESFLNQKNQEFDNYVKGMLESDNSEKVGNTLALVDFFSRNYDTDKTTVLNHLDSYINDYYGENTPRKTALTAIGDEFKRSRLNNKIAFLRNGSLNTDDELYKKWAAEDIAELKKSLPPEDAEIRGIPTKFLKSAAGLVGSSLDSLVVSGVVALATQGLGSAAFFAQLVPKLKGAQKIVAVGLSKLPQAAASFNTSWALERGYIADEMFELGINEEIIKNNTLGYSAVAGGLESVGIELLLSNTPGLKQLARQSFLKIMLKDRAKYNLAKSTATILKENGIRSAINIAGETGTETLQTYVEHLAVEHAKQLEIDINEHNKDLKEDDLKYIKLATKDELIAKLKDTAIQTAQGMAVLGIVGAGGNTFIESAQNKAEVTKYKQSQDAAQKIKDEMKTKNEKANTAEEKYKKAQEEYHEYPSESNLKSMEAARKEFQGFEIKPEPSDTKALLEAEYAELNAGEQTEGTLARINEIERELERLDSEESTPETTPIMTREEWEAAERERIQINQTQNITTNIREEVDPVILERFRTETKRANMSEAELDSLLLVHKAVASGQNLNLNTFIETGMNPAIAASYEDVINDPTGEIAQQYNIDSEALKLYQDEGAKIKKEGKIIKGAIVLDRDGKALYLMTKHAGFDTWIHEAGHFFRRTLRPDLLKKAEDYYGIKNSNWNRANEEQFTEDLTTYLKTGKAPIPSLLEAFRIIADYLISLVKGLDSHGELSPEIKEVFDELFANSNSPAFQSQQAGILHHAEEIQKQEALQRYTTNKKFNDDRQSLDKNNRPNSPKPKQPTNNLDEIYRLVEDSREEFDQYVNKLQEKYGGKIISRVDLKDKRRAARKITPYKGAEEILDINGKTLVLDSIQSIVSVMQDLHNRDEVLRLKDRFKTPSQDHYRDALINIKMSNGSVIELQLNMPQMITAKEDLGGHFFYELKEQARAISKESIAELSEMGMVKLYDEAFDAALAEANINASSLDMGVLFGKISAEVQSLGASSRDLLANTTQKLGNLYAIGRSSHSKNLSLGSSKSGTSTAESGDVNLSLDAAEADSKSSFIDLSSTNNIAQNENNVNNKNKKPILFQLDESEKSDIITDEELEEIGIAYGSKEKYKQALKEAGNALRMRRDTRSVRSSKGKELPVQSGKSLLAESELQKLKRINIVGKQINSRDDVAALFSLFRDPRVEVFNIIYTSETGEILAHTAWTSGIPNISKALNKSSRDESIKHIRKTMQGLNATRIWIAHNHPSGNIKASEADVNVTKAYQDEFSDNFGGHIILDHDKYNYLSMGVETEYKLTIPVKNNINSNVSSQTPIRDRNNPANIFKNILKQESDVDVLAVLDNANRIISWNYLSEESNIKDIKNYMRIVGGAAVIMISNNNNGFNHYAGIYQRYLSSKYDIFLDIIKISKKTGSVENSSNPGRHPEWANLDVNSRDVMNLINNKTDQPVLFQANPDGYYEYVKSAVENGVYVSDTILIEFAGEPWARSEIEERDYLRREIINYSNESDFADFGVTTSIENRPRIYFISLYREVKKQEESGQDLSPGQANRGFIESLTKDVLTSYIKSYRDSQAQVTFPDEFMQNSYYGLLKGRDLNEGEYKNLMIKIKAEPAKYRQFFATILEDHEALAKLDQERALYPEQSELDKIRADNKALRQANKKADKTVEALNTDIYWYENKIKSLKGNVKNLEAAIDHIIETDVEVTKDTLKSAKEEAKLQSEIAKEELKDTVKSAREEARASEKAKVERVATELKEKFADYKEAKRQRKIAARLIRTIMKKPAAMIDYDFAQSIRDIQKQYTIKRLTGHRAFSRLENLRNKLTDPALKASERKIIERELSAKQSLSEMNIEQLTDIAEAITKLAREGFNKRLSWLIDKQRERALHINKINEENKTDKKSGTHGRVGTGKEYKGSLLKYLGASLLDIQRLTDWMGSTAKELLVNKVLEAENGKLRNLNRRQEAVKDKMQKLGVTVNNLAEKVDIMGEQFTRDSLIGFFIALQNDDSLAAILYGNLKNHPDPEGFFSAVENTLTDKEKEFANWMIDSFSGEDKERLFQTYLQDKNDMPESVLRYFPMFRQDVETKDYKYDSEIASDMKARSGRGKAYPGKKFTIARIHNLNPENQKPISVNALSNYMKAIEMQEHYIANMQLVKDLQYIFGKASPDIVLKYGTAWNQTIEKYLNNVANPNAFKFRLETEKAFYKIISNSVAGALMFNAASALKQFAGMPLYFRDAGISGVAFSFMESIFNFKNMQKFVYENSSKVKNRNMDDFLENINLKINNPDAKGRVVAQLQKWGLAPLEAMDKWTVIMGWNAVYRKVLKKTGDHESAVKAANDTFLRTQPQGESKDSATIYQHPIARPFLTFTKSTHQIFQMMTSDFARAIAERNIKRIGYDLAALAVAGFLIGAITRQRLPDDEEEVIKDIVSQITIGLPIVGSDITNFINGEFFAGRGRQLAPATVALEALKTGKTLLDEDKNFEQKFYAGMKVTTEAMKALGLPGLITWRGYKAFQEQNLRYVVFGRDVEETD